MDLDELLGGLDPWPGPAAEGAEAAEAAIGIGFSIDELFGMGGSAAPLQL